MKEVEPTDCHVSFLLEVKEVEPTVSCFLPGFHGFSSVGSKVFPVGFHDFLLFGKYLRLRRRVATAPRRRPALPRAHW